jgi:hypothetical protein
VAGPDHIAVSDVLTELIKTGVVNSKNRDKFGIIRLMAKDYILQITP